MRRKRFVRGRRSFGRKSYRSRGRRRGSYGRRRRGNGVKRLRIGYRF